MMTKDYADNGVGFATSVGRVSRSLVMNEVMACNRVAARLTAPSQRPDFLGGTSAEFMPLPDSWTVCGLFSALSVKINDDLRLSVAVGAKTTSTTQLFCASMVAPVQVSRATVKSC